MADSTSMHRHRAAIPQSPSVIEDQPLIHALNVIVRDVIKDAVRKLSGIRKEGVGSFLVHPRIVMQGLRGGYSCFPFGVVHGFTLGRITASKHVHGATL